MMAANTNHEVDYASSTGNRALTLAPAILLFGAAQFLLLLVAAEALYPGYSVATNAISDLGVGETAIVFNTSIILFGAASFGAAYLLRRRLGGCSPSAWHSQASERSVSGSFLKRSAFPTISRH
jgi:membrane protein implicated in regulation of membrane protease activity